MHTIPILLLLALSHRVLGNPIIYLNDDQPRLERSLGNLPCRPLSADYNWQIVINATQPQDYMVENQTIFANASVVHSGATQTLVQREPLPSTAALASSVAQPTGVEEARCIEIERIIRSRYRPTSIDLGPVLLGADISSKYLVRIQSSYPVYRITARGRLPGTPDIPGAYHLIYAADSGIFTLQRTSYVKISVAFATTEPKDIDVTLYQILLSNQNLVTT